MVNISVGIDSRQLAAIDRRCGILGDSRKIDAAINRAAKRAADSAKAETKRQIPSSYTVPGPHVGKTLSTEKNSGSGVVGATMRIKDSPISLPKFKGTNPKKPTPKRPQAQRIQVKQGGSGFVTHKLFPARMKNDHDGIFRRIPGTQMRNKKKEQIKEIHGPATTGMFKNPDVTEGVTRRAQEVLAERLDHEIGRLLQG